MERLKNARLKEEFIKIEHKSGLTILLYPMKGYSSAYALFGTKFGSIDNRFMINGETIDIPDGTAHFLEHKMFENEDGDAFDLFAKTGASANAYTSFDKTCYLFSTADNFGESIRSLLSFVTQPYFTKETVEKEQGIIGQEIRMYDDDPNWRVMFNMLSALYQKNPIRKDIAGTVESISTINDRILYDIYGVFYNLNNMVLAVSGNFDPDEVIKAADEILKPAPKLDIKRIEQKEPDKIRESFVSQKLEVSVPMFCIGFKETPSEGEKLCRNEVVSEMLLELIAGEGSDLYRELYDEGLINGSFGTEVMSVRGCFTEMFEGESKSPRTVFTRLLEKIEAVRKNLVTPEEFERAKKLIYGRMVRRFNDIESVAGMLVNSHFSDVLIYDTIEAAANVTLEEVNAYLKDGFDPEKAALSVILPASEDK